jgi:predicted transcriptional regulator
MPRPEPPDVPPQLHELESEIMDEIWRRGSSTTVHDVTDELNAAADAPRAYTTYMTVMRRLHAKGFLDRRREGRCDVYSPQLTREQYRELRARADVAELVSHYGETALVHFARALDELDPDRQRALRNVARHA